ncbi:MAG: glycosyltransferase [Candidatus Didemnitutus sp.]|nr:glycosyltransferase [Candidatus Didemnitutus sp.]
MARRILQVVRSLRSETGGVAVAARTLEATLTARGEHVSTVSLDPADAVRAGVRVFGRRSLGYGYAADFAPWLRAHRDEFDAVLVHGLWQYPGFGTWRALRDSRTPYFVFCHGMLDPWFKRTYPLKHLKKWLYWPWAEYRVLRDAAGVLFTTEEERRLARASFALYRAREHVVPLGVSTPPVDTPEQHAAFRARLPALGTRPFLLFLGRIHPKKGLEELLRGYAAVERATTGVPDLVIAGPCGDESFRAHLRTLAAGLGVGERVHWLPMIEGEEKWGALRACEAFVLFSHQENFGLAVVEALACGRPVLISDQVNVWREIAETGAGLVGPDTVEGATATLARWLGSETPAREAMAEASQRCFERHFATEPAAECLMAAIEAALARSTPGSSSATLRAAS